MEERKQKKIGNEEGGKMTLKRERRVSVSLFSCLLHFLKFTEYSLDKKRGGRSQGNPSFCRSKSQSLLGN